MGHVGLSSRCSTILHLYEAGCGKGTEESFPHPPSLSLEALRQHLVDAQVLCDAGVLRQQHFGSPFVHPLERKHLLSSTNSPSRKQPRLRSLLGPARASRVSSSWTRNARKSRTERVLVTSSTSCYCSMLQDGQRRDRQNVNSRRRKEPHVLDECLLSNSCMARLESCGSASSGNAAGSSVVILWTKDRTSKSTKTSKRVDRSAVQSKLCDLL